MTKCGSWPQDDDDDDDVFGVTGCRRKDAVCPLPRQSNTINRCLLFFCSIVVVVVSLGTDASSRDVRKSGLCCSSFCT